MLGSLKSYWAFTKTGYRFVMFGLIPIAVLVTALGFVAVDSEMIVLALVISFLVLWMVEPMSDRLFLGGFYGKNKGALEFLQSSNKFSKFMQDVVIVDIFRRMATYLITYLIICMIGYVNGVEKEMEINMFVACSFLPFYSMLISQIEVLVGRHFDMWNHQYIVVMVGFILQGIGLTSLIKLFLTTGMEVVWTITALFFVVFVVVAIGTVVYTNKVVKRSYYDK